MDLLRNSRQDEYTRFREAIEIFRREGVTDVLEEHDVICEVFLIHKFVLNQDNWYLSFKLN